MAVNDAPVAAADSLAATEDTPVTYTAAQLLGNDSDVDGDTLTIASVTSGAGGTAVLNAGGTVTFTPNANFNGSADFTYTATDGSLISNTATVAVAVAAANDAPTNLSLSGSSVIENAAGVAVGTLSATDADAETHTFTIRLGGNGAEFGIQDNQLVAGANGLDYEAGSTRTVIVRATDGAGQFVEKTFTIAVLDAVEGMLTTGNDIVSADPAGTDLIGNSSTLNNGDQINGGDGTDALVLYGSGTYSLDQLNQFSGIEQVRLINGNASSSTTLSFGTV